MSLLERPALRRGLLLASVFTVAACGLAYELLSAAISSYLMGDAVTQFSLVVGTFLCAMGLGAWLSRFVRARLLATFVAVEIGVGLLGGLSSVILFSASALFEPIFPLVFYGLCVMIGAGVGLDVPLLVRILREDSELSEAVSDTLALDYLGSLVGSLLVPFVALPYVGIARSTVLFGLANLVVAGLGVRLLGGGARRLRGALWSSALVLLLAFFGSARLVGFLEDLHYQDEIVYAKSTSYQRIVLTRWRDDVRLYLDGHLQLSSTDEARYHEPLVIPAMESVPRAERVLILGGGDGLAAREVLKYPSVRALTVVDLDPEMTRLARERRELLALNGGALTDGRVRVVNQDALRFAEEDTGFYDVIIADLPDPHSPALAKLYSTSFYAMLARRLTARGALVTHATSPFFAPEAFWCVDATLAAAAEPPLRTWPYHANVPSFGEWGWVLAHRVEVDPRRLRPSVPTRFLNAETMAAMFAFPEDMRRPEGVEPNRMDQPVLNLYYNRGWNTYNE